MRNDKLVVLICDDSLLIRTRLKDYLLEKGNIEVIEAADGQAAADAYRSNKPDLVFLDIVMPVKNGLEVLGEIKSFDEQANIIMVSSAGTEEHVEKAIRRGAEGFIQKPWDLPQLDDIMARLIVRGC